MKSKPEEGDCFLSESCDFCEYCQKNGCDGCGGMGLCEEPRQGRNLLFLQKTWVLPILFALNSQQQPMRFSELLRRANAVKQNTSIVARLKELEQEKIITRTVLTNSPIAVEYALTKRGTIVAKAIRELAKKIIEKETRLA